MWVTCILRGWMRLVGVQNVLPVIFADFIFHWCLIWKQCLSGVTLKYIHLLWSHAIFSWAFTIFHRHSSLIVCKSLYSHNNDLKIPCISFIIFLVFHQKWIIGNRNSPQKVHDARKCFGWFNVRLCSFLQTYYLEVFYAHKAVLIFNQHCATMYLCVCSCPVQWCAKNCHTKFELPRAGCNGSSLRLL